jgi:hypothetical protein
MNETLLGIFAGVGAGLQGYVGYQQGQVGNSDLQPAGIPIVHKTDNTIIILIAAIAAIFLLKK